MRTRACLSLDLACVLVFVGIGRSVHDHGLNVAGLASTAWPFVSGMAVGWAASAALRRPGSALGTGVLVCVATVAIGMALRVLSGQGTAVAFVVVALGFLSLTMLGWRLAFESLRRLRSKRPVYSGRGP
jgi:hypothetical protein